MDKENRQLLAQAIDEKAASYFSSDSVQISFQTRLLEIAENHLVIENTIPFDYIKQVTSGTHFFFQVAMIRFQAVSITSDGVNIIFPLADNSLIEETRQAERFPFAPEEKVICEILNPYDRETRISKPVLDMSAFGLSLRTTYESKLIQPGTYLPEIKVLIDGEPYKQSAGQVIYQRRLMNLQGHARIQVGIKFVSERTK
jgi:hypothetical protein